jgi:hypothetical protein
LPVHLSYCPGRVASSSLSFSAFWSEWPSSLQCLCFTRLTHFNLEDGGSVFLLNVHVRLQTTRYRNREDTIMLFVSLSLFLIPFTSYFNVLLLLVVLYFNYQPCLLI